MILRFSATSVAFRRPQLSHVLVALIAILVLLLTPTPTAATEITNHEFLGPVTRTTSPGQVLKGFVKPEKNWLPGHRGVDLAARLGDPIFAAGSGTVLYVGTIAGTPVISIEHATGLRTTYQPVMANVAIGDLVVAGDLIGTLAPNKSGEAGLHWGAKYGAEDYINPLSLLPKPVIRLKLL